MEKKMRKTILTIIGTLLIAGSTLQMATAAEHHVREQFRNANNSVERSASTWCSTDPGNPYNPATDYEGWSAWREDGGWDSRNDCQ
jgi:hypothetical protein